MRFPELLLAARARPGRSALVAAAATAIAAGAVVTMRCAPDAPTKRTAIQLSCADEAACALGTEIAVDVWTENRGPGMPLDIVVTAEGLSALAERGIAWEVLVDDIDAVAAAERERLQSPAAQHAEFFAEYRDYRAITERLIELARLDPERVTMHGIGSSIEGRTIWALRIKGRAPDGKRTPMLVDGTLHAREWIAAMTTTCIADRAARDGERDPLVRALLDHTDLWVVPVANPDGYQYSWASNRYWRKNRRGKHGVDLNRNFSVAWGGAGSSKSERSDIYRGAYAFSEPETAALRDLAKREQIKLHVDFHSYGQLLLYPWSYTGTPTKDASVYSSLADRIGTGMFAARGHRYKPLNGVDLYPASGTMTDWAYGDVGALSFTIELRPSEGRGLRGFVLPPDQIVPTCDEALAGLAAFRRGL